MGSSMNLTVLISSPADQQKEANAAMEAVDHLNDLLRPYEHSLRCINWQRNIATGRADRAQDVVNEQVQDADILIAIIGLRVGTDTGKYASGTIEEIENFLAKEVGEKASFDVHVFFNNGSVDNPLSINTDELKKVQELRDSLNARGVNFGQFSNLDTLKDLVRIGLNEFIARSKPEVVDNEEDPLAEFEELGSVEAGELAEQYLLEATDMMRKIGKSLESTNQRISEATNSAPADRSDKVAAKGFFKSVSVILDESRQELKPIVQSMRRALSLNYAYLNLALTIEIEDASHNGEQVDYSELKEAISTALESSAEALEGFTGARTALGGLPRKTSDIKRSKRLLLEVYDEIISAITNFRRDQSLIREMLSPPCG